MDFFITSLAEHGYSILFAAVFLETVGFPVPAAIALLMAGGASATGALQGSRVLAIALSAMLVGDTLMFLLGRYTGWWLLSVLCRLSLNPESCILRSADSFYKRGRTLLIFAKFVPGINTMAPPLAGSMNMRFGQFLLRDAAGAALYISAYWSAGFLFSDAINVIVGGVRTFGQVVEWILIAAVAGYAVLLARSWVKARALRAIVRVSATEAARAMSVEGAVIYDVRSHGYYELNAIRIRGSVRLEPNALHQKAELPHLSPGRPIYLYCTCVRQATSLRVAKEMIDHGVQVAVIEGGLRAWKKAGLPLESVPPEEVSALPAFDA